MEGLLERIYERYNDLESRGYYILHSKAALQILKEGVHNESEFKEKLQKYDLILLNESNHELVSRFTIEQPESQMFRMLYLEVILGSMPEDIFQKMKISKKKVLQVTLSIMIYYLLLQTHKVIQKSLSKSEKKWLFQREDFYIGLEELRLVCWEIQQEDLNIYSDIFAFDIENKSIDDVSNKKLYKYKGDIFILNIQEFLDYILYEMENILKRENEERKFSLYQKKKGDAFEIIVYDFLRTFNSDIAHSIFYYPQRDKECEIDVLLKNENKLLIIECKSGTIELREATTDEEIKRKVDNKVKKAYRTLENANCYVQNNQSYSFSNRERTIKGNSSETEVLCLHLSMYPMDSISSNIHILEETYIGNSENPKITMSFEHFVAIYIDCLKRKISFEDYLLQRKQLILKYPKMSFDINELDLYFQLTNKMQKSMLTESLEKGILDDLNPNAQITTVFHHESGKEYRPASEMLKEVDSILLHNLFQKAKRAYGLNKRFMAHFKDYITINDATQFGK